MALGGTGVASAFSTSQFTTQSKLSSGKWVKISVPETGVYEITYDELRTMGFSNPDQVRLYGVGGYRISEILNGKAVDDLQPVPVMRVGDKLCFYGNGSIRYTLSTYTTVPHFTREFNPYSQVGCYFLTEESSAELQMTQKPAILINNPVDKPTSLDFFYHEKEMASISNSGKEMLGEDFSNGPVKVDYYLPELADSTIVVNTCLAANASAISYANAVLHSGGAADTTTYTMGSSRIYKPSGDAVVYNFASPYGALRLSHPSEHGQLEPLLISTAADFSTTVARLDYFILTYTRNNIIHAESDNQIRMTFAATRGNERFMLPGATPTTVVWCISDVYDPMVMTLSPYNDESGEGYCYFANAASHSDYVAFDPAQTLKKVSAYEPVGNQNLHGMAVPDLLIITDKMFMDQAERIADLHRAVDGIDVAVVDHEQIYNEFSSGTRDAMAYRLLCKMLYDRDPAKLKNLLLMGPGTLDNRELLGKHPNHLVTYHSDNSNYEEYSFITDDFFGFLNDQSGSNIAAEYLNIGVGRITCTTPEEARSLVDKLVEYYANPDYGVWRNNTLVFSDSPEDGDYMFQGEGYRNQIDNELNTGMHVTTVHNTQYPRSNTQPIIIMSRKEANVAKQLLSEQFKSGVYFATYVGHAGTTALTKYNNMWTTSDVFNTDMPHLPIVSTACCNVARFDGDTRGIAEWMFHKRNGGAIALLTTSRMCYSNGNDKMNTNFVNAMFTRDAQGNPYTLGQVYRNSKNAFGAQDNNKMKFFLLGDPAIQLNYPVSRFQIVKVNNTDVTDTLSAQISPLMQFEVEAQVLDGDGNLDTAFNGDATVTLYGTKERFTTMHRVVNSQSVDRPIYLNRDKLTEITGRVTGGIFHGQMISPMVPVVSDDTTATSLLLRVYAHQDNSTVMVNGLTEQIEILPYDAAQAIQDDAAPVINSMFINDEQTFASGATVAPDALLYITASDDQGLNIQPTSVDGAMLLSLDGGKPTMADVYCYVNAGEGGKSVSIEYPLKNLSEGQHTLTYTVYDLVGNSTTHSITFMVGQTSASSLVADKLPAYTDGEVAFDLETELTRTPDFIVCVTDATGKLMWKTRTSSFPVSWDMRDLEGNKVPAGLYRYYGTYSDGSNYGGTPISKLIVLDPVKTAHN